MPKSKTLTDRIKSFADKISGTTRVDNASNPASAYSMARRKEANTPKMNKMYSFASKQKTIGVPGAQ